MKRFLLPLCILGALLLSACNDSISVEDRTVVLTGDGQEITQEFVEDVVHYRDGFNIHVENLTNEKIKWQEPGFSLSDEGYKEEFTKAMKKYKTFLDTKDFVAVTDLENEMLPHLEDSREYQIKAIDEYEKYVETEDKKHLEKADDLLFDAGVAYELFHNTAIHSESAELFQ